ncbi:hypothetical protein KJ632_04875 [Patescibacteria group bacterium]|nr:hypothetical protein [Patescibacteria group bacterium]
MLKYLVFVGALANFLGASYYLKKTIRGEVRPNRVSFLLWGTAPLIGVIAAFSDEVRLAVIPVLFASLMPLMIFAASFYNKKAYWKLGRFDYACGIFSILALILWAITRDPKIAIFFAILADGFATIPTLKKSWTHPKSETAISYGASLFSQTTVIFALEIYSFSELAFPIYLGTMNIAIISTLLVSRHKK